MITQFKIWNNGIESLFEGYKKYTLRLNDYMLKDLMKNAINNLSYSTINDIILNTDYDLSDNFETLIRSIYPNIKLIKIFIDKGSKKLINKRAYAMILINCNSNISTKIKILKILLDNGHDLSIKYNDVDFFDVLIFKTRFKINHYNKDAYFILSFLKDNFPNEYEIYLIRMNSKKYNL